jgi:AcrR family transcriptional regulator
LISADGPEGAGLVSICHRVGVSRGAFYHHFSTKEEAVTAVREQARRDLTALTDEVFKTSHEGPDSLPTSVVAPAAFCAGFCQLLRSNVTVRAGTQLPSERGAMPPRSLRQELLDEVHRRTAELLAREAGDDRLAELAVVIAAGLESLGREDAEWWSAETCNRMWQALSPLFTQSPLPPPACTA